MDAISLDDWEILPDHKGSSFLEEECSNGGHGAVGGTLDEETKKPGLPSEGAYWHDPVTEFKDIAVMPAEPRREEIVSKVTELVIYDSEEDDMIEPPASVKEADADQGEVLVAADAPEGQCAREEEAFNRSGISVGNLRVNGVGALCSFGVAAATFFIFLLGGGKQLQQKRQDHKIQLQMYAGDERIQQVVQQASRLNQTMSSVMGGASSARASISFGGYYQGF
ncbi:hypothetical protein HU200_029875 [Digitaria exilis]|uniref:DUF6821 domain-containing protein n=1 Tax=Digitaria exilis TaxID=1010633 RepID=A0A835EU66_9POAL|nr:hypothetical protein HU200_029875 [Digitaria exilis]